VPAPGYTVWTIQ
jgi:hypothetical protein